MIKQLAKDLKMEPTILHRCVRFAQQYSRSQIVAPGQQFTWTHYRELMSLSDSKEASLIVLRSSKSDRYDRYLADVFIPQEGKEDIYLNNLLLEKVYAERV